MPTPATPDRRVAFGPCLFDLASGELWKDGRRVRLQRQPARLLELLVARPGTLVTREEIRDALWGPETFVDFERSLNFCVARLRAALGDDASSPRFVETVPTRGYRLVAPLATADGVAPPRDSRRSLYAWAYAVACAALVVGLWAGSYVHTRHAIPTVVVVPFHNETGQPDLDRVAKGVSDVAVARLANSDALRVIGNAAGVAFSFRPPDIKAIGASLGAEYLVLGQLKRDARHARIVAHLIRVSDQTHVWAQTYDSDTLDLAAQAAIAEEIAKAVAAHLPLTS
jgi:TolB-like protein/DNA-binding winged helix-turn-helix (wHTH) protein